MRRYETFHCIYYLHSDKSSMKTLSFHLGANKKDASDSMAIQVYAHAIICHKGLLPLLAHFELYACPTYIHIESHEIILMRFSAHYPNLYHFLLCDICAD